MTSEVAGLTESKFSATQAGPCSHTDVPIVLTVALCLVPVIPRFANFACFAASRASKSSPRPGQVALGAREPEARTIKPERLSMTGRPYVVLSCAMSLDGCLDGTGEDRLVLSGPADLDRVDAERAAADAILVGAGTIRRDDPRLLVRSARRQAERRAGGRPSQPAGVTVTASGDLDPAARFFTRDAGERGAGDGGVG